MFGYGKIEAFKKRILEVSFMHRNFDILPIDLLDDFPLSPFFQKNDEELLNLLESITNHGILQPIIVRPVGERYQIISGHRRRRVHEIPVILKRWKNTVCGVKTIRETPTSVMRMQSS